MSMPNIPNIEPAIDINVDDMVNIILASIGLEELGLAHIINAAGEEIQDVLGTLEGQLPKNPTIDDLERINDSVNKLLKKVIKKEILLEMKLEEALEVNTRTTTTTTTSTTTTTTTTTERPD